MKQSRLMDFLSEGNAPSSKRLICFILTICFVIQHFLLMYVKIEIPNRDLVSSSQDGMKWMIMAFGGFIALPSILDKMNLGGPKNIVSQDVDKQIVNTDPTKTA